MGKKRIRCRAARLGMLAGLIAAAMAFAEDSAAKPAGDVRRLLYVTAPDGAMRSRGKPGIYVYDIDDGHKLVKHISIPDMGGTRGVVASARARKLWYSHRNTNLACLDLMTEKKLWDIRYPKEEGGADRICVTPDGRKVYVPEGWWSNRAKYMKVVDGATGKLLKKIPLGVGNGHNSIMSPSGLRMYLGPIGNGTMFVVDTRTDEIIKRFGPFGGRAMPDGTIRGGRVSPYTVNGAETLCFVNSHHVGFYVGDLRAQRVLHWVQVPEAGGFSHGVGMTPDEREIWLANPKDKRLWVFDATVMPPRRLRSIDVSCTSHGWVSFSVDGRFAWPDTGDVTDARTKRVIATLRGLNGKGVIRSSKFIEVHFRDGVPIRVGDQFGIGRVRPEAGAKQVAAAEPCPTTAPPAAGKLKRFATGSPFDTEYKPPVVRDGKRIWARSCLWAKAPKLVVEKWLTDEPDTKGKYALIEFWATWCPPCRRSISLLNEFHGKFGKDLVVIGISDETEAAVRKLMKPALRYYSAIDTQGRMKKALGVWGIPHVIIVEPGGYVIWEGFPLLKGYELTEATIEKILAIGRKTGALKGR